MTRVRDRVLLASEVRLVREAVATALQTLGDFEVTTTDYDIGAIVSSKHAVTPDVILLAPAQTLRSDRRGARLSVISQVRDVLPHIPVVMLGPAPSPILVRAALGDGALAYVLRDEGLEDLAAALHSAARWQPYIGPVLRRWFAEGPAGGIEAIPSRDLDVLALLARGRTSAEIARALHLSVRSVEVSRARAFRLLHADGKAQAVDAAIDLGLVA